MKQGISYQGFLPIRTEPSHAAEMVSQVLFGERFTINDSMGSWHLIEMENGGSTGWVLHDIHLKEEPEKGPDSVKTMVIHPSLSVLDTLNGRPLLLPAGSILENPASKKESVSEERFRKVNDTGWIHPGKENDPEMIGNFLLSIPHLHGGRCGFGFDAPGLVQMLCRAMGINLPHSIKGQAEPGTILNFFNEAQKGDLAFFNNGEDYFTHVGMILGGGRILHVSDQVRIDPIDQQGIYSNEKKDYTHYLRVIKSVKSVS